jgi:small subunit ribosomal protein S3
VKEEFHYTHFVQILIMVLPKLTQHFGRLGVKVWIYKGEVIESRAERAASALAAAKAPKPTRTNRAPRAPRGEVTTSSVAERAAAADTATPTESGAN